jgi:hypothetical protein
MIDLAFSGLFSLTAANAVSNIAKWRKRDPFTLFSDKSKGRNKFSG